MYILLGPKDNKPYDLSPAEQAVLALYQDTLLDHVAPTERSIHRWGRLRLPNGQLARSRWKEVDRSSKLARTDRILKVDSIQLTYNFNFV